MSISGFALHNPRDNFHIDYNANDAPLDVQGNNSA